MKTENLQSIKGEILFFMEKVFQFSFVYIGALFAVLASSKLEIGEALAEKLTVSSLYLGLNAFLLLNLVYLVLSCSCLFAILKRGHFILVHYRSATDEPLVRWEKYARKSPVGFRKITWNIDNYYVVLLLVLVFIGSGAALCLFWNDLGKDDPRLLPAILLVSHLIPVWALCSSIKLLHLAKPYVSR